MAIEEQVAKATIGAAAGAVAGTVSGMCNAAAPHLRRGAGPLYNQASNFFNGASKSFKAHHKVGQAVAAGGTAVGVAIGHGAVGAAAAAAAPFILPVAAVAGVGIGVYKLAQYLGQKKA